MEFMDPRVLIILMVLLYLLAAILSIALSRQQKVANIMSNAFCILASLVGIMGSTLALLGESPVIQIISVKSVVPYFTLNVSMDHLSAFFVLALSVLVLCVSIFSLSYMAHYYGKQKVGFFNFLYAAFILSMFLVITAGNAAFFYIVWEIMSLLSFFLFVFESEHAEAEKAGTLYIVMMHVGSAFLLIAFMMMFHYTGSFDLSGNAALIPGLAKDLMFIFFFIGFGTKAGLIPFHIWLPYAHPAAPSNVSALMSGIMIKTAIYGMIRFMFCYLGIQNSWWGILLLSVGVISCVLGVAYAMMEHNIKRLLAFHSIENIGIIVMGIGIGFIASAQDKPFLCSLAMSAALLHTFNHALFKGGLFLGAGAIQYSTGTKDIEKLGGLIKKMPVTAIFFLCFSLAISAVVPFNGFVSEWLTYQALFIGIQPGQVGFNILAICSVAALALAGAMAAGCFIKLFGISFLGRARTACAAEAENVPLSMNLGMGILALLCLLIGIFPLLALKGVNTVVASLSGYSLLAHLKGGLLIAYVPLQIAGNTIDSLTVCIATLLIIGLTFVLIRIIAGKPVVRRSGTWDCGFNALNPRMQYSATGFSKPLRIVFRMLYRPGRALQVQAGQSVYFPESMRYTVTTESIFEKYIYRPIFQWTQKLSRTTSFSIQTGSIHMYLTYIFVTLLLLMLYNQLT
ncbi:MAG: proton-conducting transporter membrane subunit [Bacillota bacterium]|nr:proton-conducting transporter membrane subunit [Bacillota bacterium]